MLSVFPELFTYQLLAPFILRIAAGLIFLSFASDKLFTRREQSIAFFGDLGLRPARFYWGIISFAELIGGFMLVIGYYTQVATLVLAIIMLIASGLKVWKPDALGSPLAHYLLLFAVLISLLFLGAGFWAVDLPL